VKDTVKKLNKPKGKQEKKKKKEDSIEKTKKKIQLLSFFKFTIPKLLI
jgi:hypothetical protein